MNNNEFFPYNTLHGINIQEKKRQSDRCILCIKLQREHNSLHSLFPSSNFHLVASQKEKEKKKTFQKQNLLTHI